MRSCVGTVATLTMRRPRGAKFGPSSATASRADCTPTIAAQWRKTAVNRNWDPLFELGPPRSHFRHDGNLRRIAN